jgi:CRISPR system Cascade subunit CasE
MFLSRIELGSRAADGDAFWREVSGAYGAHQALWRLLSRGPDEKRDFLFRAEDASNRPSFLVLSSARPEEPASGLWCVDAKPFAPSLTAGQRLRFRLRASPVVRRGEQIEGKAHRRVHRHDVVMDLTRSLRDAGQPLPDLADRVTTAGIAWLSRQAETAGFRLCESELEVIGEDGLLDAERRPSVRVDGYRQHRITRRRETPIRFSTLDFEGVLEVTNPAVFVTRVCAGFGPQKAFGCGLMLLRRA